MIQVVCEQCGQKNEYSDAHAVTCAQCRKCGQVLDIPFSGDGLPHGPGAARPAGQQQANPPQLPPLADDAQYRRRRRRAVGPLAIPPEPLPSPMGKVERGVLAVLVVAVLLPWSIQVTNLVQAAITARRSADNLDAFSARLDKLRDKEEYSNCKESWKELRSQCLSGDPKEEITSRIKSIDDRLDDVQYLLPDRWREAISPAPHRTSLNGSLLYLYVLRCIKSDNWAALQKIMTKQYSHFYGPRSTVSFAGGPRGGPDGLIVLYAMEHSRICRDPARLECLIEVFESLNRPDDAPIYQRSMLKGVIGFLVSRERYKQAVPLVKCLEQWAFLDQTISRLSSRRPLERRWSDDARFLLGVLRRASRHKEARALLMRLKEIVFSDRARTVYGKYQQREFAGWYMHYVRALDSSWGLSKDWLAQMHAEYKKEYDYLRKNRLRTPLKELVFKRVSYPHPLPRELPKEYRQGYSDVSTRNTKGIKEMWGWLERDRKQYEGRRAWHTGIGQYHFRLMGYSLGVLDALDDIRDGTTRAVAGDDKRKAGR